MIHSNQFKYLKAPSVELIDQVIKELGVTAATFERYFGMYPKCISHAKNGFRKLPAKYWHLFYEKNEERKEKEIVKIESIEMAQPDNKIKENNRVKELLELTSSS